MKTLFIILVLVVALSVNEASEFLDIEPDTEPAVDDNCVIKSIIKDILRRRFIDDEVDESKSVNQEIEDVFNIFKNCAKKKIKENEFFQKLSGTKEKVNEIVQDVSKISTRMKDALDGEKIALNINFNEKIDSLGKVANDFLQIFMPNNSAEKIKTNITVSFLLVLSILFNYLLH